MEHRTYATYEKKDDVLYPIEGHPELKDKLIYEIVTLEEMERLRSIEKLFAERKEQDIRAKL